MNKHRGSSWSDYIREQQAELNEELNEQWGTYAEYKKDDIENSKQGVKFDDDKPMMELLPPTALRAVARVMTFGAKKYSPHNWRKGFKWSRLQAATLRHLYSHIEGDDVDHETDELHLAHAVCCLLFLLEHQIKGYGEDDRYKEPEHDMQIEED